MKRLFLIAAMTFLAGNMLFAQDIWRDEKLNYVMYLGPIKAGEASLVTKNVVRDGKKRVQMDLIARTTSTVEKIFSLNERTALRSISRSTVLRAMTLCVKR